MSVTIFNIQRYSLHDGGGIRTIIFFKGCPFTCPWCCNPESLSKLPQIIVHPNLCIHCSSEDPYKCTKTPQECPTNALELIGEEKKSDDLVEEVLKDKIFYETSNGGVTFSGGEPLLNEAFIIELSKKLKEHNINLALETTLAVPLKQLNLLSNLIDTFLIDFKIFNHQKSLEILKIDLDIFKANFEQLAKVHHNIIVRLPIIPGYNDNIDNLNEIIKYLKSFKIKQIHLLPFHQLGQSKYEGLRKEYKLKELSTLKDGEIEKYKLFLEKYGYIVTVGGV